MFMTPAQRAFGFSRKIPLVIRTAHEGLLHECTKAGPKQTPGANGTVHIFAATYAGKVLVWRSYRRWCGARAVECFKELRRELAHHLLSVRFKRRHVHGEGGSYRGPRHGCAEVAKVAKVAKRICIK